MGVPINPKDIEAQQLCMNTFAEILAKEEYPTDSQLAQILRHTKSVEIPGIVRDYIASTLNGELKRKRGNRGDAYADILPGQFAFKIISPKTLALRKLRKEYDKLMEAPDMRSEKAYEILQDKTRPFSRDGEPLKFDRFKELIYSVKG